MSPRPSSLEQRSHLGESSPPFIFHHRCCHDNNQWRSFIGQVHIPRHRSSWDFLPFLPAERQSSQPGVTQGKWQQLKPSVAKSLIILLESERFFLWFPLLRRGGAWPWWWLTGREETILAWSWHFPDSGRGKLHPLPYLSPLCWLGSSIPRIQLPSRLSQGIIGAISGLAVTSPAGAKPPAVTFHHFPWQPFPAPMCSPAAFDLSIPSSWD